MEGFYEKQVEKVAAVSVGIEHFEGCVAEDVSAAKNFAAEGGNNGVAELPLFPFAQLLDPVASVGRELVFALGR